MNMTNVLYSIIGVCHNNAVEVWYGPTNYAHLIQNLVGNSARLMVWLIVRMLADKALHVARTLADGGCIG